MIKRLLLLCIVAFSASSLAAPLTAAEWHRGESEHYVIHANLDEDDLRELVQLAEDFGRVLTTILPRETQSGRKLQIYLERNSSRISRISDWNNIGWVGSYTEFPGSFGVYDPREDRLTRNHTLFYALAGHHIDNGYFRPSPPWVKTGVQLFFSTVYVTDEGHFILGAPDQQRPMEGSMDASKLELLLSSAGPPRTQNAWNRFYGWSREAMFPMLILPENAGLLENYLNAYGAGKSLAEASEELGDLDAWARQVRDRQVTRSPTFRRVVLEPIAPAEIAIRPMSEDEVDLIDMRFERLNPERVESAARRLDRLTERFPDSAEVWFEFAAAEFARVRASNFGGGQVFRGFGFSNGEIVVSANPYSDAAAWRAVNRALSIDPQMAQAKVLKAEILMSRLVRADNSDGSETDEDEAFDEVRAMLAPLASDPERNPMAAALFHQSYIEQDRAPPQMAVEQLGRAFVANPGVEAFRYAYAVTLSRAGQRDMAERLLTSMLNHPKYSEAAQRALEQNAR